MDYDKHFDKLVRQDPIKVYKEFLISLKNLFQAYLDHKVTAVTVSNITVLWCSMSDDFNDVLIKIDRRIKDLYAGMDITDHAFSRARREKIVKELIERVDEILKNPKK